MVADLVDASGSPQMLGAASPGPGAPPQPPSGSWGFLRADVAPGDASLYIDGRGVGSANQFAGPDQFVALTPGAAPRGSAEVRPPSLMPGRRSSNDMRITGGVPWS